MGRKQALRQCLQGVENGRSADGSFGWKADIAKGNHEAHSQTGGAVMSAVQMAFERHAGEVAQ